MAGRSITRGELTALGLSDRVNAPPSVDDCRYERIAVCAVGMGCSRSSRWKSSSAPGPAAAPSLEDRLPRDHVARFVADLVGDVPDLGPVLADCTDKRGYPPYDPRRLAQKLGMVTMGRVALDGTKSDASEVSRHPLKHPFMPIPRGVARSGWQAARPEEHPTRHPSNMSS
jgi:hypothetical protein